MHMCTQLECLLNHPLKAELLIFLQTIASGIFNTYVHVLKQHAQAITLIDNVLNISDSLSRAATTGSMSSRQVTDVPDHALGRSVSTDHGNDASRLTPNPQRGSLSQGCQDGVGSRRDSAFRN